MTREHRVSRRVLLGAACVFALAGSARAFPSSSFQRRLESRRRWDRALALVRRAAARLELCREACLEPCREACLERSRNGAAESGVDEALFDRRLGAFYRALQRLLRTPAPDLRALSFKIDLAIDHEVAELTGGKACLAMLKRDARRLAGLTA